MSAEGTKGEVVRQGRTCGSPCQTAHGGLCVRVSGLWGAAGRPPGGPPIAPPDQRSGPPQGCVSKLSALARGRPPIRPESSPPPPGRASEWLQALARPRLPPPQRDRQVGAPPGLPAGEPDIMPSLLSVGGVPRWMDQAPEGGAWAGGGPRAPPQRYVS